MTIKLNISLSKVFNKHIYDHLFDYDTSTEVHYGGASVWGSHGVFQKIVIKALKTGRSPERSLCFEKSVLLSVTQSCRCANIVVFRHSEYVQVDMSALHRCRMAQ